jgi:hypothetical protein
MRLMGLESPKANPTPMEKDGPNLRLFLVEFHFQCGLLLGLLGLTTDTIDTWCVYVVYSPPVSVWLSMRHFPRF